MISLETTWDTVLMLLIAAGAGLIGGIGGALLELRRPESERAACWPLASSVILGGIAAVAILYFFPPQETVSSGTTIVTQYNLSKLVALALIVGSAGSTVLLSLQARTTAALNERRVVSTEGTGKAWTEKLGDQANAAAKAGVEAAGSTIQEAMLKATSMSRKEVTKDRVEEVVKEVVDQTTATVKEQIDPAVKGAVRAIEAAADGGEGEGEADGDARSTKLD